MYVFSGHDGIGLEISIGVYFGVRVGINLAEVFDFIVGIFRFDPLRDDETIRFGHREAPRTLIVKKIGNPN